MNEGLKHNHQRQCQDKESFKPVPALFSHLNPADKNHTVKREHSHHTEKAKLWALLDAEPATGIQLTESFAMLPAASVSGWYFGHPEARYFAVDLLTRDQVESYAKRKGLTLAEAERWLAPNLGYDGQ